MLDFGTDMETPETPEREDELFSVPAEPPAEKPPVNAPSAEKKAEKKTEKAAAPKQPTIKPPTLPKYTEPLSPPQKILPVLRNNPHFLHRKRKSEEFSTEDKMEVSRILKAARNSTGLSLQDVENATQIRAHYLAALEEGDYDKLPQPVYVLAYLRKLCRLYDIPEEEENQLVRPWRNFHCELPENLPNAVQQDEDNPNRKVLYRLEIILLAAAALIVTGVVVLIIVLVVSYFSGKDVPEPEFNNTKLLELQPKQELLIPEQQKVQ